MALQLHPLGPASPVYLAGRLEADSGLTYPTKGWAGQEQKESHGDGSRLDQDKCLRGRRASGMGEGLS